VPLARLTAIPAEILSSQIELLLRVLQLPVSLAHIGLVPLVPFKLTAHRTRKEKLAPPALTRDWSMVMVGMEMASQIE
jgi:hypothetical protein